VRDHHPKTAEPGTARRRPTALPPLPAHLAEIMRIELPSLATEIITEIRDKIPEYARPMEGPYGQALRVGVQQALTSFFDAVADPAAALERRDDVCRRLGRYEAQEGRSLDSLQAAYRIGVHVAWRRVMEVGLRDDLPSAVMSQLADVMLAYMDELASLSLEGYLEAKARSAGSQEEWRRRLLHLIVERPPAPRRAIRELAGLVGWAVPDEVTLVAVQAVAGCATPLPDGDVLADFSSALPYLLLPGPLDLPGREVLAAGLAGRRAAVGLTVPLADAADSLRWARQALVLATAGIVGDSQVTMCEDHLVTLWLLQDEALLGQLARRQFAALDGLTERQRQRLTETLSAWLETRGTAAEIAGRLHVHPQTVRYRMRQLERTLGDQLADPDARFATEVALRATQLNQQAPSPAAPAPD
jgi:hypothetical protein